MKREKGFTLIELMIVVAIIAIIAAIAIPQLLRSRISSNETAAIGTLTTLRTVQAQFQQAIIVDQNGNGIGEYGLFQELSGQEIPRGAVGARTPGEFISQEMGAVDAGIATKAGYHYLIYLPVDGLVGPAASEGDVDLTTTVPADADEQEVRWCCYAWPVGRTETGNRAFCVNQTGTVYQTQNDADTQLYTGAVPPAPGAAFMAVAGNPAIENLGGRFPRLGAGETGADLGTWVPVN